MGTSFLHTAAHDSDQGVNAAITYSMLEHQVAYFQINPSTGWVYVNRLISQVASLPAGTEQPQPLTPIAEGSVQSLDLYKTLCKYPRFSLFHRPLALVAVL